MSTETKTAAAETSNGNAEPTWPSLRTDTTAEDDGPSLDGVGMPLDAAFATPDDFFNVAPPLSELWIPEMGRKVYIRFLNGKEVDAYRQSITVGRGQNITIDQRGMRAKLAVLALANSDASRMFADKDAGRVATWPAIVLERIFDRARKINGMTDEDTDDEKGKS